MLFLTIVKYVIITFLPVNMQSNYKYRLEPINTIGYIQLS